MPSKKKSTTKIETHRMSNAELSLYISNFLKIVPYAPKDDWHVINGTTIMSGSDEFVCDCKTEGAARYMKYLEPKRLASFFEEIRHRLPIKIEGA